MKRHRKALRRELAGVTLAGLTRLLSRKAQPRPARKPGQDPGEARLPAGEPGPGTEAAWLGIETYIAP